MRRDRLNIPFVGAIVLTILIAYGLAAAQTTAVVRVGMTVEDMDRAVIAKQIKETEKRMAELEQGSPLDKEITRLDHLKALDYHLHGTAMH